MKKGGYVYILTNKWNTVLYTGVTASLTRRIHEHINKNDPGSFTAKYNCDKLIYYLGFHTIEEAIAEETRVKGLSRKKKDAIIDSMNPEWKDLYTDLIE